MAYGYGRYRRGGYGGYRRGYRRRMYGGPRFGYRRRFAGRRYGRSRTARRYYVGGRVF